MKMWQSNTCLLGLFALLLVLGCAEAEPTLIPVNGKLLIDGKAAGNIMLQAMPDVTKSNTGPTSTATTDDQGNFSLATLDGKPGAVTGAHVITFTDLEEDRPEQGEESATASRLPSKFQTTAGGLNVEIVAGKDLELSVNTKE